MAKISKNIKKLRSDKKLTQDALAVKMNVTRQTISSWETGRTLPDIEMIENLAEVFGVSAEEIIYGDKRKVGLEAEERDKRKIMGITFAVIGSAFTAAGVVILFVNFWRMFYLPVQTLFSFVPLAAGAAFAVFVYLKKRDSLILMESSACVWGIGMIATNALINSVYSVHLGFDNLLIIDAVFVLFIGLLMDSSAVKAAFFVLIDIWLWRVSSEDAYIQTALFFVLLFAGAFAFLFRQKADNIKIVPVGWAAVLSLGLGICFFGNIFDRNGTGLMVMSISAVFTALYALDNGKRKFYPFKYPAVLGCVVFDTIYGIIGMSNFRDSSFKIFDIYNLAGTAIFLALIAGAAFAGRESIKNNPFKLVFIMLSLIFTLLFRFSVPSPYITALIDIVLIAAGIKKAQILTANLGLLSLCVILITLIFGFDMNFIIKGLFCVAAGVLLILSNTLMTKLFSKRKEAQNNG